MLWLGVRQFFGMFLVTRGGRIALERSGFVEVVVRFDLNWNGSDDRNTDLGGISQELCTTRHLRNLELIAVVRPGVAPDPRGLSGCLPTPSGFSPLG